MPSQGDLDVVERLVLPPDPGLAAGLGANHTLPSAIADLIDNSIDAGSGSVRVQFTTTESRVVGIAVADAGRGMDESAINDAMTLGKRRPYRMGDLGHFGLGLKAAGLSIADTLTVWSRASGSHPVGRRLRRADLATDFGCDKLSADVCEQRDAWRKELFPSETGTVVELTSLRNVHVGGTPREASAWLSEQIEQLRSHLGMTFHRMIRNQHIRIEVERRETTEAGRPIPIPVTAIDPFSYPASGYPGYPKALTADLGNSTSTLRCHIWPAKTDVTGFRLGRTPGERLQGLYLYRGNRLVQFGAWNNVAVARVDRQLARIEIDLEPIESLVQLNPEKSGLKLDPTLVAAIQAAKGADESDTFEKFLENAESVFARGQRRNTSRKPTVRPAKGFSRRLRSALNRELDFVDDKEPVSVRWRNLPEGEFFDVDFPGRTIWLNQRYRTLLRGNDRSSVNDAPILKALVFLLANDVFNGQYLGKRDKDNILLWKTILGDALQDQFDE